ncbi:MAG: alanine racemase [Candidatus Cloacimonadota bacterium]|nr:MAG: alanine racemase [Candidatus Cloacimonadota bacterium]
MNNEYRSWTEINLDNYNENLRELKRFLSPETKLMQIVKADAYGHGAIEISREAIKNGITYLGIANADEGILLRMEGINIPILILSPCLKSEFNEVIEYNLMPCISSISEAKALNRIANSHKKKVVIHINIDTGMGRCGFLWNKALEDIKKISQLPYLEIEGIFSHFAMSEDVSSNFTTIQAKRYINLLEQLEHIGIKPKIKHLANSAAVVNFPEYQFDLVRIGLLAFGIYANPHLKKKINLLPVMSFKTRINLIKQFPANYGISYNQTYITKHSQKIAVISTGYADGYNFLLSNKGKVIIRNEFCPILGRITMDLVMVDVTKLAFVQIGDEVTLLGISENNILRADEIATQYDGSSYEILCNVGRRAHRVFIKNKEQITTEPISRRNFLAQDFSDTKLNKIIRASLTQRTNSEEIGNMIFNELLEHILAPIKSDKKILPYRKNFQHKIVFKDSSFKPDYFLAISKLKYKKILTNDSFKIVCAKSLKKLESYFQLSDVEYRWLIDKDIELEGAFRIDKVAINDIALHYETKYKNSNMEIKCTHQDLKNLLNQEVDFTIDTTSYYPKNKHQLSIYFVELTKGIDVEFEFSDTKINNVETVTIFAGREKYPQEIKQTKGITIRTSPEEWILPNSGIIFVW